MKKVIITAIVVLAIVFVISQRSEDIANEAPAEFVGPSVTKGEDGVKENGGYKLINRSNFPGVSSGYDFAATIPASWQTEARAGGAVLNIYNPALEAENELERSQIYITSFVANNFQVSEELSILSRTSTEVDGHPAVTYVVSQESGQTPSGEPSWLGETHKLTTVRLHEENPSRFYVFAKNPDLSEGEFQRFLNSLSFD